MLSQLLVKDLNKIKVQTQNKVGVVNALPKDISVDPTCPTFSLGLDTWCKDESTALRLTACPQMMLSHSELGNPRGAVLDTAGLGLYTH